MKNLKLHLCCALITASLAQPALAQFAITDIGLTPPTPNSVNDVTNIFPGYQFNDGLNYWWDNGNPNGQTFTTRSNPGGYTLTNLAIKTAGGGGGSELSSQTFTLRIYSVDNSGNATLVHIDTATGKLNTEGDWLMWSGLGVSLLPNTNYAYTFSGGTGYEELANNGSNPYAGGEICQIPSGGGTVIYGATHVSDATCNIGLAPGTVSGGTVTIADIGTLPPTPGPNDISQLVGDAQNSYGMNYYWDSNPGQTFTTPNSSVPWVMNRLALKFAGGGGGGQFNPQNFIVRIYSVSNGTTASLIYSNAPASAATLASDNGEWFDCTGMSVVLQPNRQYAWTFSRGAGSGSWELLAARDGNPYPGGMICLVPVAGGTIVYGNQGSGNKSSDAGFIVGLVSPLVYALPPTYTPNTATIYAGTPVTLNEAAVGSGAPFSYQWQTDGGSGGALTNLPGATSSNLVLDTTSLLGTYNYAVIASTAAGGGASSTSSVVTLNISGASAPFIVTDTTASPNATTNYVGNSEIFSVSVNGTGPIAYQWYKASDSSGTGSTAVPNATNTTLTFSSLALGDTGYYNVVATNKVSPYSVQSTRAQLTVLPASAMLIHWQTPVAFNGLPAVQILTNPISAGSGILEAAHFGPSTNIPVIVNGSTYSNTVTFYGDGSKITLTGNAGKTTGAYLTGGSLTTSNANFDNVLNQFAYDGGSHTITLHNLAVGSNYYVQVFALDDRGPGLSRSTSFQDPSQSADVSATYGMAENKYLVGTFTASSTDVAILQNLLPSGQGNINAAVVGTVGWAPGYPPSFTTQPASVVTTAGATVHFTATADAQPAATYRWQISTDGGLTFNNLSDGAFGGATISGSVSNVLTIANVSLADNGWMVQNIATNSFGGVLSSQATLRVVTPQGNPEYWDIVGAGAWDTITANWASDSNGISGGILWTNGNNAIFSIITGSTGQFNVTVTNTGVGVNNIIQNFGQIRLTTGPISLLNTACVVTVNNFASSGDYDIRFDSDLTGSASIVKNGPGRLHLLGNKTFSGGLVLNAGRLAFEPASDDATVGLGTGPIALNGGEFVKNWNSITVTNPLNVLGSVSVGAVYTVQSANLYLTGPWLAGSTSGNFIVTNVFSSLSGDNDNLGVQSMTIFVQGDISQYTGTFTHNCLSSGGNRLRFGSSGAGVVDGSTARFFTEGATGGNGFDLADGFSGTMKMGELAGTGGKILAGWTSTGNTTFEIGALNTSTTYAGSILDNPNGSGGKSCVTKVGTGTLTLSGANNYSGPTIVNGGTLQINSAFLNANTNVTITSSGKLALNFSGADTVNALFVAGVQMAAGTYGATGSGAANVDNTHFASTGVLQVTTGPAAPPPASITNSISGHVLSLSWPAGKGWRLVSQTNSLSAGLSSTNWGTVSGAADGSYSITIDATEPTVFYRLVYP